MDSQLTEQTEHSDNIDINILDSVRDHRREIERLAAKWGGHNLRIFGSVARGEATPDSDIDILAEFDSEHSLLDRIALMRELEELLHRKVDVVTENSLHWLIRQEVLRQAVPL